jgi:CheY-like chemotaxis protein
LYISPEQIPGFHDISGKQGDRALEDSIVILVVEDDQLIRTVVEETLDVGGFKPAVAASGEEAVTLLQGQNKYRALVTDIHLLGRIDGWEVAKRAREIDPAFPIIYMTGAAADEWASHGVPNSILLTKPFAPAQLVTALSNLLNDSSPSA